MATFDLLQVSITAVSSDWVVGVKGKPEGGMTRVLRPGTVDILFGRLRMARRTQRIPSSASALFKEGAAGGDPRDATMTGGSPLGETEEPLKPLTTCFKRAASAVKFWVIRTVPPNSAIAIKRLGPALASINFAAAVRALA